MIENFGRDGAVMAGEVLVVFLWGRFIVLASIAYL